MIVLGLAAHAPDASAVLVRDGQVLAAIREEAYTGELRERGYPRRAIRACLRQARIEPGAIDRVVWSEKPLRTFERVLATQLRGFPRTSGTFAKSMFTWLGDRLWVRGDVSAELGVPPDKVLFAEHQLCQATGTAAASPFDEAAVLTVGPAGEWATTSLAAWRNGTAELLEEIHEPHALSKLMAVAAAFLGLEQITAQRHVAALARWGTPRFTQAFARLVPVAADGSFTLVPALVEATRDEEKIDASLLQEALGAPRVPGEPFRFEGDDTRDADVAASAVAVIGDVLLGLVRRLHELVPVQALCLGGELATIPAVNARLLAEGPFTRLSAAPFGGQASAALGAAVLGAEGEVATRSNGQQSALALDLGPDACVPEPEGPEPETLADEDAAAARVADAVCDGRLVGWIHGRLEFGPLGGAHRALCLDPRDAEAAERLSRAVTREPSYLTLDALVTEEAAPDLFVVPVGGLPALHQGLLSVELAPGAAEKLAGLRAPDGKLTVRLVNRERDPLLHAMLTRVGERTGVAAVGHAPLGRHGSPVVRDEQEGLVLRSRSELDLLVAGTHVYAGEG